MGRCDWAMGLPSLLTRLCPGAATASLYLQVVLWDLLFHFPSLPFALLLIPELHREGELMEF